MISPFNVEVEDLGNGARAFNVRGELDHATAPELREPLRSAIEGGATGVLVDLSDCEFIDSTGLAVLVHAYSDLARRNGTSRFELCCADPQVKRLLEITGLDHEIDLYPDRDEAVAALTG